MTKLEIQDKMPFRGGQILSFRRGPYTLHVQVFENNEGGITIGNNAVEQNRPALLSRKVFINNPDIEERKVSSMSEAKKQIRRKI